MSYILDALKKSEQERGHGSVPGVQTIHSSSINYHDEKKSIWPLLLFALVFINVAGLAYFILTKQQPETVATIGQQIGNDITTEPTQNFSAENTRAADTRQAEPMQTIAQADEKQNTSSLQTNIKSDEMTADKIIMETPIQKTVHIKQPVETIDLYDIPLRVRQHIPAMKFSAHIYSTNASIRSIMINGRFMEEGDAVTNDLILNEITSDGAIFDFQGYRFSTSVLSSWDIN